MPLHKRIIIFITAFTGILLLQACGRELPHEEPCNFVQNSNLQRVSWEDSVPVDLHLDSSIPAEYVTAIQGAIQHWNQVGQTLRKKDFFRLRTEVRGASTPAQDNFSKIYLMNTWEANKPTEQARTTIYWSGSRIYEADIRINEKNFDFYMSNSADYSKVHLESLLVHEFGHVLGLAHTDAADSVMQVSLANGKSRTELGHNDLSSVQCEY
jgi:hypothetical protein